MGQSLQSSLKSFFSPHLPKEEKTHHNHAPITIRDEFKNYEQVKTALEKAGLEHVDLIVAIDCTKSNTWNGKRTFENKCLHHLSHSNQLNPYQQVLQAILHTLKEFETHGEIPAFRFGCSQTEDHSVLPLRPNCRDENCSGFEDMYKAYNEMAQAIQDKKIQMSGPTSFAAPVQRAIQIVREQATYHILLIICDGQVESVAETRQAILDARRVGLSIVIIGVGDGNGFDEMKFLDDDLCDESNEIDWDNINFLNFSKVWTEENSNPYRFAWQVLMEIPQQYAFVKKHQILEKLKTQSQYLGHRKRKEQKSQIPTAPPPPQSNYSIYPHFEGEVGEVETTEEGQEGHEQ